MGDTRFYFLVMTSSVWLIMRVVATPGPAEVGGLIVSPIRGHNGLLGIVFVS